MTKDQIIARVFQLVPPGTPYPQGEPLLTELKALSASLVDLAKVSGQIIDPFQAIYDRQISMPTNQLQALISDWVVLVTGDTLAKNSLQNCKSINQKQLSPLIICMKIVIHALSVVLSFPLFTNIP